MRCDEARIAAMVDEGESVGAAATDHIATCHACRRHLADVARLRTLLAAVPPAPSDLLGAAHRRMRRAAPARWAVPAIAAAIAAVATFVPLRMVVSDVPEQAVVGSALERLAMIQADTRDVAVGLVIREWGLHPDVPVRSYEGSVIAHGPESAHLVIEDVTAYPDPAWVPNDVEVVIDDGMRFVSAGVRCPVRLLPACVAPPVGSVTVGHPPFDVRGAPADVAIPFDAAAAGGPLVAGPGGDLETSVTVTQAAPLLEVLVGRGTWRDLYPADPVTLRFDPSTLEFRGLEVAALDSETRAAWAVANGYDEAAGSPVLEVEVRTIDDRAIPSVPSDTATADFGFRDGGGLEPIGRYEPHRTGTVGDVRIDAWANGLERLVITTRPDSGDFGVAHALVTPLDVGTGRGYADPVGRRLLFRTAEGMIVEVAGNGSVDDLVEAAEQAGVAGVPVAADRPEAAALDSATVESEHPGLVAPGLGTPAVVRDGGVVRAAWWLGGDAVVELTIRPGGDLAPPLSGGVVGVVLDVGVDGRYTPALGRLEWRHDGAIWAIEGHGSDLTSLAGWARAMIR